MQTWPPTPIHKFEDQRVEIQLTQVGDEQDLDLERHAIARRLNYLEKALVPHLQKRFQWSTILM